MIRALFAAAVLATVAAGCVKQGRGQTARGAAGIFENTEEVKAPLQNRCEKLGKSSVRGSCDEALYLGQRYVRGLHAGDSVCLEQVFGEEPGGACLARARVADVGNEQLLIDIKDAQPNSRWYSRVSSEIWFDEGALVDLYLGERGY